MTRENPLERAALWYGQRGWPVIPLHSARDGNCTCNKSDCDSPAKHPRTANGLKDASPGAETIKRWWTKWPNANIGICTGADAGVIAMDIDPRHGGDESWAKLIAEHGELPATVEAITGSGGRHFLFVHSGGVIRNKTDIRPGIDSRGDGGYIVATPSRHVCGEFYRWREGHKPTEIQPAAVPDWLLQLLVSESPTSPARTTTPTNGDGVEVLIDAACRYVAKAAGAGEGGRNKAAFALGGHLAAFELDQGGLRLTERQILDVMRPWNHRNSPPLSDAELETTVKKAMTNGTPRAAHVVHVNRQTRKMGQNTTDGKKRPGVSSTSTRLIVDRFQPFPVEALPEPVRSFVTNGAKAIGCDSSYIALPLLAALASAIGNNWRIQLKRGWVEPPILWTLLVGESGDQKTPAFELAMKPLRELESHALEQYGEKMAAFERAKLEYDFAVRKWKGGASGDPPEKPEEPQPARFIVSDTTIEALAVILESNPRGVLLERDELAGWIDSFDRYTGGKGGGDVAHWLSMHRAVSMTVDRKSTARKIIHVPRPAVCIAGGIQSRTLARAIRGRYRENGLAARLLMAWPSPKVKRWTEVDIAPEAEAQLALLFDRLLELRPSTYGNKPEPVIVPLGPEAKQSWVAFFNEHNEERAELTGDLAAAWSKLEGYAARLALVIHFIRWAAGDPAVADAQAIDGQSMVSGIVLSKWFGGEAKRIYAMLDEPEEDRDRRWMVELIQRKGGSVTARELMRSSRLFPTAEDAEAALNELVEGGRGRWDITPPGPTGGKPSKRFVLLEAVDTVDSDNTPDGGSVDGGIVNVNTVNGSEDGADPENNPGDEWGEL